MNLTDPRPVARFSPDRKYRYILTRQVGFADRAIIDCPSDLIEQHLRLVDLAREYVSQVIRVRRELTRWIEE